MTAEKGFDVSGEDSESVIMKPVIAQYVVGLNTTVTPPPAPA